MAAEAAAKAQNSPALKRAAAAAAAGEEGATEAPSAEIREVELEVAIDPPVSNGHIAQL